MDMIRIFFKLVLKNYKKVKLYVTANVIIISIVFWFIALITNNSFMSPSNIDPMITNNILAPTVIILIFATLFIPYSLYSFLKSNWHDYGILAIIGLKQSVIFVIQLLECFCMLVISLFIGSITGTVLHVMTIKMIMLGITCININIFPDFNAYKIIVLFYILLFVLTVILYVILTAKKKINDWIKEKKDLDKNGSNIKSVKLCTVCAAVMFIISLYVMCFYSVDNNGVWIFSMIVYMVGIYWLLCIIDSLLMKLKSREKKRFPKLLYCEFVIEFNDFKNVLFMTILLIQFSVFFLGLSFGLNSLITNNAKIYTPFHMQFVEINGCNVINNSILEKISVENTVTIKETKQLEVLRDPAVNICSVSNINNVFNESYKVPKGEFISLFQYDLNDGYEHNLMISKELYFKNYNSGKVLKLTECDQVIKILFNKNKAFADTTIIVNDTDYKKLRKIIPEPLHGKIHMFIFDDWKESENFVQAMISYFNNSNLVDDSEKGFYAISCRGEEVLKAKKSGAFLMILSSIILIVFVLAANIVLYYKIRFNEVQSHMFYMQLFIMGMNQEGIEKLNRFKNLTIFCVPVIISMFGAVIYVFSVNRIYSQERWGTLFSLIIILILFTGQCMISYIYTLRSWHHILD